MEIKQGMRVNTVDDGPGVVVTANRGGRHLVKLDDGNEYWEPADEVTPIFEPKIRWQDQPATHKQIQYLVNLGVEVEIEGLTKSQASTLIDENK